MENWEFTIVGNGSEDIHGIGLREEIRKIAVKDGISGSVENIKKDGSVKVICHTENEEKANVFFEKIIKISDLPTSVKFDKSNKRKLSYDPPANQEANGFQILRADELSEMVWALQGAGKVFALQGKIRIRSLNRALQYALNEISECATELTDQKSKRKFVTFAIENYLKECPTDDRELIGSLYNLLQFCYTANYQIENMTKPDIEQLSKISKLCSKIEGQMEKLNNNGSDN